MPLQFSEVAENDLVWHGHSCSICGQRFQYLVGPKSEHHWIQEQDQDCREEAMRCERQHRPKVQLEKVFGGSIHVDGQQT